MQRQKLTFSLETLSSVLNKPKKSIKRKLDCGDLKRCEETGLISSEGLEGVNDIRMLLENKWEEELLIKPVRDFNVVEIFGGCGGMALGMERAGLINIFINEKDKNACDTLRSNRSHWNVVQADIADIDFSQICQSVDVVVGGFPCQAFSSAGNRLGFNDARGIMFFEMARAIKELKPMVFVSENVKGLLNHDGGKTLSTIKKVIAEIGYYLVEPKILRAFFFKVPQKRDRLFLVGIRNDLEYFDYQWPGYHHKIMTLRDAFYAGSLFDRNVDDLNSEGQSYSKRKREIMEMIPQGGFWRDLPEELQREYMGRSFHLKGGRTGMARRLSINEPSLTLTCSPAQKQTERCHPFETRPLRIREYARIQTFPDSWVFKGSVTSQYRQIGNAVPVNLSAAVGRSIVRFLNSVMRN